MSIGVSVREPQCQQIRNYGRIFDVRPLDIRFETVNDDTAPFIANLTTEQPPSGCRTTGSPPQVAARMLKAGA
jgi:hypothetical protein